MIFLAPLTHRFEYEFVLVHLLYPVFSLPFPCVDVEYRRPKHATATLRQTCAIVGTGTASRRHSVIVQIQVSPSTRWRQIRVGGAENNFGPSRLLPHFNPLTRNQKGI